MTCYTKENKTKIVNQSRTVAASIAVASKLTSDVVLRGDILEVNFRSNRESNSSKTFAAAKEFAGRFNKHYKGTNISTDSRDVDNSSYAVLSLTDNEVDRLSNKAQLSKASRDNQVLESEFRQIADKLTAKTGIKYEILSPKETLERLAKNGRDISEFTEDTAPAFFTKDSIVFPSNKLTADTAFHEFAHPFVDAITNTNKTLFSALKSQLKNSPSGVEIIDYVKELYSELLDEKGELTEMGWKEVITQALGELANNNLNQSKDKELIVALKKLLETISDYLNSLINNGNKTIKPVELKVNTTLEELAVMLNLDNKIELNSINQNTIESIEKNRSLELDKLITDIFPNTKEKRLFYHGSKTKFDEFKKEFLGKNTNPNKGEFPQFDDSYLGFHFSETPDYYRSRHEFGSRYENNLNEYIVIINTLNPGYYNDKDVFTDFIHTKSGGFKDNDSIIYDIHTQSGFYGDVFKDIIIPKDESQIHILTQKEIDILNEINSKYDNELKNLDIQMSKKNPNTQQAEAKAEPKPFSKQQQSLTNRLKTLTRDLSNYTKTDPRYADKYAHIIKLKDRLKELAENPTEAGYEEVGRDLIKDAMEYVTKVKTGEYSETKDKWLNSIADIIDTWKDFPELETEVGRLKRNFFGLFDNNIVEKVNSHTTEKTPVTLEKIDAQNEDVSLWTGGTGSLADLANYIAKTIGLEIKSSQNKIARQNIIDTKKIQAEVDALNEYASKNGLDIESVWDDLIEDHKGGTVLVKRYNKDGTENEKYTKIMSTPGLEKFYNFYQEMIVDKQSITSYTEGGKYFIPNLAKISTKNSLKKANPLKTRKLGQSFEEDMSLDVVPLKFIDKIDSADKNRDLGYALLAFSQHANQYSEMSDILPGLRLMQEYLKYNKESPTKQKQFKSSINPNKMINADQTNLWKMIDKIIDMQVIGKMKIDQGHFAYGTKIDENGDLVQKYVDFRQVGDSLLRWNSLLRIGFNPISAFANIMFGDITNTLEAVGGRFFSYKNLLQASKIFANQVGKKDSVLNTVLHPELNFLQELDDYTYLEEVRSTGKKKGLTGAKLEEYAYSMQKSGENWIQSRVALGIMIKDEYIDSNGVLTEKYTKASDKEKQALTDKIQRVNHMNHGRYTTKESAAWQQSVLFRMVSQFRKYIPAAIENRIGAYNPHDNRLGVETEGRYRTLGREVLKEGLTNPIQALENLFLPIISAKKALKKGNLTEMEIYNMRKMMIEIIMATASVVAFAGLTSGSDEDRKKRMRNPFVKFTLTMLNRMSGDLTYFYDPANITTFSKTAIPMTKLLTDLGNTITYAIKGYPFYAGDWEIEHGSFKHRNKFYKTVSGITPGAKSVQDIWRMTNDQALEEFNAK